MSRLQLHSLTHRSSRTRDQLEDELDELDTRVKIVLQLRPSDTVRNTTYRTQLAEDIGNSRSRFEKLETKEFPALISGLTQTLIGRQDGHHNKIGSITRLWNELPTISNRQGGNIGDTMWFDDNPENDGFVITDDMLDTARRILAAFCNAWLSFPDQRANTDVRAKLELLRKMPRIIMTLKAMGGRDWIDYFLHSGIWDSSFPLGLRMLTNTVFPEDTASVAERFYAEQRRIQPRLWGNQEHFDLLSHEPHPFHKLQPPRGTTRYSSVHIVQNAFDGQFYALKLSNDLPGNRALAHLQNDAKHLRDVCNDCAKAQVPHVVRLVNSFSRNGRFGMLIEPAATMNLEQLLLKIGAEPEMLTSLRSVLLNGIGCLCRTLEHIHEVKETRHRDIKPSNILYQKSDLGSKPLLLWSDFGLAKLLQDAATAVSATYGHFEGTPEYASPEQRKARVRHGRSSDIFSFGCVVFEILHTLFYHDHTKYNGQFPRRFWNYSDQIQALHEEIDKMITEENRRSKTFRASLSDMFQSGSARPHMRQHSGSGPASSNMTGPSFTPLLELVKRMTLEDARQRPKAHQVMKELHKMQKDGLDLFCSECLEAVKNEQRAMVFKSPRRRYHELRDWWHPPTPTMTSVR